MALLIVFLSGSRAFAHSVGQIEATKFLAPETVQLLSDRVTLGSPGFQVGDTVSYIIDFYPIPNSATIGAGGYLTEYLPAGTEVVGASLVQPDGAGDYVVVAPDIPGPISNGWGGHGRQTFDVAPWDTVYDARCAGVTPGECNTSLAQLYADTGIFYSTDSRTALATCTDASCAVPDPFGKIRQGTNGYNISPTGESQMNPLVGNASNSATTHNLWDAAQSNAFGSSSTGEPAPTSTQVPAGNGGRGVTPLDAGSAVAGPDSGSWRDDTGNVGPWKRIAYPGSRIGNPVGPAISSTGSSGDPVDSSTAIVGTYTSAGWDLSPANPLPAGTNALRFAVGRLVVGQRRFAKVSVRLTSPPVSLVNNSEVFGGDSAQAAGKNGNDNPWRYAVPSVASCPADIFVVVDIVQVNGASSTGEIIPTNAEIRYRITYINLSAATHTSVSIAHTLPSQTGNGSVSNLVVVSGPNILPISPASPPGGGTFTFQTIGSLAPGGGGVVEFDVQTNAGNEDVVIDQTTITSTQLPDGVTSRAVSITGAMANLLVTKAASPTTEVPGGTVSYTITVRNTGTDPASSIVVHDVLPTSGGALSATTRFNFVPGSSVISGIASVVPTTVAPPTVAPYTTENRQQVTWNFGAATLAAGSSFTIQFQATIGAALLTPATYANDGVVIYDNGSVADMETTFPTTAPVDVDAPPTIAVAASATPNPVPGTTTTLSVLGADDGGEPNLTYAWAQTAGPVAASLSANGTNAAKSTTATFTQAGSYTFQVTATDQGGLTATSSVVVTVNQTATSVTVTPASATVHPHGTQAYAASLRDQFGAAMAVQPTFAWTVGGGGTIASNGTFTAGTAAGGPFTVTASDAGSGRSGTASVTVVNDPPTIATPASATPSPVGGTTTALAVLGADDGGEANLTYTWAQTAGPAATGFSPNGTNAAKSTTATFTQAGSYTFQVTVTDEGGLTATSNVTVTVNQTATSVTVTPASADVHPHATQAYAASLRDQFGAAMAVQPTFSWTVGGGGTIASNGAFTAGAAAGGPFTVTASDAGSGLSGPASVTVVNDPPTIATPANATPSPVPGTTTALAVLGADDGGEPNLTYTWTQTGGPAAVGLTANGTNAARATTATFTQAGSYSFQVTVTDEGGLTVTSTVAVTVDQTATSVTVTPASANVHPHATQAYAASLRDQFGAAMAVQPTFGWTVAGGGTIATSGTFTAGGMAGGPFTVTASDAGSGLSGTASVAVVNDPPTIATPAVATPSPVTAAATALGVLGADDGGEPNLTYTWTQTGGPAAAAFGANGTNAAQATSVTFTRAGGYTFQVTVTDEDGLTATDVVTVIVEHVLSTIEVSAAVIVGLFDATTFTASAFDQFDDPMAPQPSFLWSVAGGGTIDGNGRFLAGGNGGGPFTVTATSGSVQGTSAVTIEDLPPFVVIPPAGSPDPLVGPTATLTVLGGDDAGEPNLTYTWVETDGPESVTFERNDSNAARETVVTFSAPGVYTFAVTITDGAGQSVVADTTVTVRGTVVIDDRMLYVRRGRFFVDWKRHARGKPRDRLRLAGYINPARLPADLSGTDVQLRFNGTVVASGTLGPTGVYGAGGKGKLKVAIRLSARSGRYRVRIARADLRSTIDLPDATASGAVVMPVTLAVSQARFASTRNRLEFGYRSVAGRRIHGRWRGPRQRLLDGAFQLIRTRSALRRKLNGYLVRSRGVMYPEGSGPVMPTDDVTLQVGEAPEITVPLGAMVRKRSSAAQAVFRYRNRDRAALLSSLVIRNGRRGLRLRFGNMPRDGMAMPQGAAVGSRADLPVRVDVPTAAGVIRFETVLELVRVRHHQGWKRPGRLPGQPLPPPFPPR